MSSDEFVVTPWNVEGDIDYDKLTKQFGTQKISPEILSKIKQITGEDHFMLRRGIFFSHRDLNLILENFEKGKKFSCIQDEVHQVIPTSVTWFHGFLQNGYRKNLM